MKYEVILVEKNEGKRSCIVAVKDRKEAELFAEGAKSFLFPGEDVEGFEYSICGAKVSVLGTQIPHWKITVYRPEEYRRWLNENMPQDVSIATVEAESEGEAIQTALSWVNKDGKTYEGFIRS